MSEGRRLGTALGFARLTVAVATVALWFHLVDLVAIPDDRTLFVVVFLLPLALGITAFVRRTRWYGSIAAVLGAGIGLFLLAMTAISRTPTRLRV